MILNPNKCHYMCIEKNIESDIFKFENVCLEHSKEVVILGVTIYNKPTFDSHIFLIILIVKYGKITV